MVRTARKQERRQIKRIYRLAAKRFFKMRSQICKVMMYDVMPADKVGIGYKSVKIPQRRRVKIRAIVLYRSQIFDPFVFHSDLAVNIYDGLCHDISLLSQPILLTYHK